MSTFDDYDSHLEGQEADAGEREKEVLASLQEQYPEKLSFSLGAGDIVHQAIQYVMTHGEMFQVIRDAAVKEITAYVKSRASTFADELIRERIATELDAVVEAGFQETNRWGEQQGERKTLKELVSEELHREQKKSSRHSDRKPSIFRETMQTQVAATVKELVAEQMPALKKNLTDQLDESWGAAVIKVIKQKLNI